MPDADRIYAASSLYSIVLYLWRGNLGVPYNSTVLKLVSPFLLLLLAPMVSLLCLSLICLDLFAAVSATRPLTQHTPRRYSPIKHDTRIAGLLLVVFGRQARGPCCSNGGLFSSLRLSSV